MATRTRLRPREERAPPLQQAVTSALEDMKAVNVKVLDVRGLTDIADTMVIASGNSDRHVRSIAERVVEKAKAAGFRPLGTEGAARRRMGAGRPAGHPGARDAAAGARVLRPRAALGRRPGTAGGGAGHDARHGAAAAHFALGAAVRVRVIAVGTRMPAWVASACDDYLTRLSSQLPIALEQIEPGARSPGHGRRQRHRRRGRAAADGAAPGRVRERAR